MPHNLPSSDDLDGGQPQSFWHGSLVIGLLIVHALTLAWLSAVNSPTLDEVAHLPSGLSHWQFGRFEAYRVNPPLVRSVAAFPVWLLRPKTDWENFTDRPHDRAEFSLGRQFVTANGAESFRLFTIARWACIPFSLIGAGVCYLWARELWGNASGIGALVLWCICPNIVGWGATIEPDAPAAALGVLASYVFWRWRRQPTWFLTVIAGIALGLAELTKTTWLILFGLWPVLGILPIRANHPELRITLRLCQLLLILAMAVYVINLGYGFEGSGAPLGSYQFISRLLGGDELQGVEAIGNRFEGSVVARWPIPLPRNYVRGIDVQRYDFEQGKWSYLRGQQQLGGWWYYYLYALAVKTPLGIILLGLLAIGRTFRDRSPHLFWTNHLHVLGTGLTLIVLVSSQTGINRYLRYVLPCLPFIFVWISQVFSEGSARLRWSRSVGFALLAWSAISSFSVMPHSLSYFNELVGGPSAGWWHLADANIDWGQDLLHLKQWYDAHPEARPLRLEYFEDSFVSPDIAGIDWEPIGPKLEPRKSEDQGSAGSIPPGWYALSVNRLLGYKHSGREDERFRVFLKLRPIARAGYSIYIYHLTSDDAATLTKPRPTSPRH